MKQFIKLLLALPLLLSGQNCKQDIQMVLQNMTTLTNYSVKIHYKLYLDENLKRPFQQSSTLVKKNTQNLFCRQSDGTEFVSNASYEIYLNSKKHTIVTKRKQNISKKNEFDFLSHALKNIDSLLSSYDQIRLLKKDAYKVSYLLHLKKSEALKDIIITIDLNKKMLANVKYTYKEKMPVAELKDTLHDATFEISYETLAEQSEKNTDCFSEKKYISFVNGKMQPAPKYKDYTLKLLK